MLRFRPNPLAPVVLVGVLATGQVLMWTLAPALTHRSPPLDVVEGYMWGREWVIATYKHPALLSWILEASRILTGVVGWPAYLVSQLVVATTFALVFLLGRDLMGAERAAAGTLLLVGVGYYEWPTTEFNHNVVQLPFWAGLPFAVWRAVDRRSIFYWLLTAASAALGLYAKLSMTLLLVAVAGWLLYDPRARQALRSRGPWIGLVLFLTMIAPLAAWLAAHDLAPLRYAASRSSGGPPPKAAVARVCANATVKSDTPQCSLAAKPASIRPGQTATLALASRHASWASIDNGIGAVPPTSATDAAPAQTTTYTATIAGDSGSNLCTATIWVTPTSASLRGTLDVATCDAAAGWAQDANAPDHPVTVSLYANGPPTDPSAMLLGTVAADQYRADLCAAIKSCNHAYTFDLSGRFEDGQSHAIYAFGRARNGTLQLLHDSIAHDARDSVVMFFINALLNLSGALVMLTIADLIGPRSHAATAPISTPPSLDPRAVKFLFLMTALPLALAMSGSLVFGSSLRAAWGIPMFNLVGPLAIAVTFPRFRPATLRRIAACAGIFLLVVPIGYALVVLFRFPMTGEAMRVNWPQSEIAERMSSIWADATHRPLRIVSGDSWIAGLVGLTARDRPSILNEGDLTLSPWISSERLQDEGMLIVWNAQTGRLPNSLRTLVASQPTREERFPWPLFPAHSELVIGYAIIQPKGRPN
jgi:Dolichyl-phosphate-mannose-protein mannosyltransferase